MIKLENITKTYDGKAQVHALKGINMTIDDGEIFGIIGKSGAGKSTLVRCINMLERPTTAKCTLLPTLDATKQCLYAWTPQLVKNLNCFMKTSVTTSQVSATRASASAY